MTWYKRTLDVVFAAALMVLLAPVMAYIAWLIWRTQDGPVFYVAERMKTPTQSFGLWKFRTMRGAPSDTGVSGGHKRARITPLGARLRATRLDELPQLWNILKGDISFVGPRPPLREYVERFPDLYARVLRSRPGVTGLATLRFHKHEAHLLSRCRTAEETDAVYARICVPRKARIDLIYQRHQTIAYDFRLGLETAAMVFGGAGRARPSRGHNRPVARQMAASLTRP
ncbi:sugar transferase [uncultured Tateyamaria sp.]|uniref:sugar transferase n=1 Tax=uncultured Tateyamaria sp. TaxID=455651 RepID=UPI0026381FE5|nr:sugar transferase [uncultured Tateyamaria sp.]